MPLFYLKCALNQPKMVQNTWNLHQSSISVSTFRKYIYEQKYIAANILAAATHFPLKIPQIPFFCEITQTVSTLRNIVIEVLNLAWIILISVPKKLPSRFFYILSGCHFIEGNSLRFPLFSPFFEGIPRNKVTTAQNIKNREGNFLETLIRIIHTKFQISMTMLRRVDAFCVILHKKGFFPLKREFKGFWGENQWQRPKF